MDCTGNKRCRWVCYDEPPPPPCKRPCEDITACEPEVKECPPCPPCPNVTDPSSLFTNQPLIDNPIPVIDTQAPSLDQIIKDVIEEEPEFEEDPLGTGSVERPDFVEPLEEEEGEDEAPSIPFQTNRKAFTPEYRKGVGGILDVNKASAESLKVGVGKSHQVTSHAPSGIGWISQETWDKSSWDGITTINPCVSSKEQIAAWVYPVDGNVMRGLRQRFEKIKPFRDEVHPTPVEVEDWGIEVIRLFRELLGLSSITHPIKKSRDLFLRAQWSVERNATRAWDSLYPGQPGDMSGPGTGPCPVGHTGKHCGSSFVPLPEHQTPYLFPGEPPIVRRAGAEAGGTINTNIPQSIKLARALSGYVIKEGLTGHTGGFIVRPEVGWTFAIIPTLPKSSGFQFKFSGPKAPFC